MINLIIADMTHADLMFFGILGTIIVLGTIVVAALGIMYVKELKKC